ncbi:hypothetical protein A2774_04480 [Candidatus Roizmanbacteria bacterium RIFCSPHIGHO2_01_FULL_39_12c]|uniref:Glycosyltransferase 2-like domain-containing protein n=1 Tax=Candidatus Roizmanbacteria bacterium RIFCSPHIGHO2_01_FULL_39_12c TaxID=1802031 RepID=A0A1F7G9D1_9BACT|nr:MAG: hypothetical protein A2774_04480 [Candidatus Roizmanbacteria bacterium RIFCSPHIGHO2_01_FULL_39_12c]OGK47778.1 MAG: hypothetical protein A2963_02890 [Candidatus Roizmanbacteria bacterium RIFCSPLOWO2_01_FULL_40_13]
MKNTKLSSITVGIPAYNEAENIGNLLKNLLKQKNTKFFAKEIIISSDGSDDNTIAVINSFSEPKIKLIDNKDRQGAARGLNQIIQAAEGDILVLLDADVRIKDSFFLEKIAISLKEKQASLAGAYYAELKPRSLFAKVLNVSMQIKHRLFSSFNKGDNIYTCHGRARALAYNFYKKLHLPVSVGNDMYVYLKCKEFNLKYCYVPEAIVWYRLPETLKDHQKQSVRFFSSEKEMERLFAPDFVRSFTRIPVGDILLAGMRSLPVILLHPFELVFYLLLEVYLKLTSQFVRQSQIWDISLSSKKL